MRFLGKISVLSFVVLAACAEPELILPGERLSVRTPVSAPAASSSSSDSRFVAARLPAPRSLVSWPNRMGTAERQSPHAALRSDFGPVWSVSIGEGESKRSRIVADPVSDGAMVFSMDALARVSAVTFEGRLAWTRDLTPSFEKAGLVSGGGLAVADGTLYATSNYGTLTAMDTRTGAVRWEQKLSAAPAGPPTVRGGLIYFVTRDNQAWALETSTGRIRWQLPGLPETAGFSGGAGPAVGNTIAVFPFSSGEVMAVLRQGGVRLRRDCHRRDRECA